MTPQQAETIVGSKLSQPSKMPGPGLGLPAAECKTGSWLRKIPKSVCSKCYALKGRYTFPKVLDAMYRRLKGLEDPLWVEAMVAFITQSKTSYFRWHDSGDVQGIEHLEKIAEIAKRLPGVKFWLPTREKSIVRAYTAQYGDFPANLCVRVSATMIDGVAPAGFANTSTVVSKNESCPSRKQGNFCGACRRCWNRRVKNVSYHTH